MVESALERKFRLAVEAEDGICLKLGLVYNNGMPDRLVLFPDGKCAFVELKQKGKKPRLIQKWQHDRLRALGYKVFVLDRPDDIEKTIKAIKDVKGEPAT